MPSLREHFENDFELVRWITYVFLGGAVNASFAQVYVDYVFSQPPIFGPLNSLQQQILFFWLPIWAIIFAPLFLSILLTRAKPEKQLVPPREIGLVSLGWFSGFMAIRYPSEIYPILLLYLFFVFFVATVENSIASLLLGMSVRPDDFISYSLEVSVEKEKLRDVLEIERIRETLGTSKGTLDEDKQVIEFEGWRTLQHQMRIRISQIPPTASSTVVVVFYDETDWYVKPVNENLKEHAESMMVYIKSLFERPEHKYSIVDKGLGRTVETEAFVSSIMAEMDGIIPRASEVSRVGWLKIVAFMAALAVIGYTAFWLQDYSISAVLFSSLLLSLVFELRSERE